MHLLAAFIAPLLVQGAGDCWLNSAGGTCDWTNGLGWCCGNDPWDGGTRWGTDWAGCGCLNCISCSTCSDGEQNGDETGTDCGGSCLACPITCVEVTAVTLGTCTPNDAGYANIDMDSLGTTAADGTTSGQSISVEFHTKEAHVDEDVCKITTSTDCPQGEDVHTSHGATQGTFTYEKINGRYVLPCKQAEGQKTIKITVKRPAEMTSFGAEWVKAYEKDSWTNVTNEYEPYTFNDFGSKIPLQEFRATTIDDDGRTIVIDANGTSELNVFMVMDEVGDYEVRYGNPQLYTDSGKWIAIEFKKHQLRVGSPWATCNTAGGSTALNADGYSNVGTIIPVYLGNPSLNIADYKAVATTLSNTYATTSDIPTKIILPIFTPLNDGADRTLTPGATTWTEGTRVVDGAIAANARNPLTAKNSAYHCTKEWKVTDTTPVESHPACSLMEYRGCYAAGASCPLDHDVCKPEFCELQRWREIIDLYQGMDNVEVLALVETQAGGTPRPEAEIEADIQLYKDHVPAISGFYFNQVGTPTYPTGTGNHVSTLLSVSSAKLKTGCPKKYLFPAVVTYVDEICFATKNEAAGVDGAVTEGDGKCGWCCMTGADCAAYAVGCTEQKCEDLDEYFVVFGVGEPLFDTNAVASATAGKPDVWVTLNDQASKLGVWTPYSWFSSLTNGYQFASTNWAAIVTDATDVADYGTALVEAGKESILTKLFDRGYGYVYMTTESDFTATSQKLATLITGIHKKTVKEPWAPTDRRLDAERALQTQDDGLAVTQFECDDTLFECQPVCVETTGVTRSKVSVDKCPGVKPDQCACRCLYDAYWTCEHNTVVCKATITGGVEQIVGDLVCATRGTPKPKWDPRYRGRTAGECEPLPVLREDRPTEACLAQYAEYGHERPPSPGPVMEKIEMGLDVEIMAPAAVPTLLAALLVVALHL
jgi:hypothetical protein